MRKSNPQDGPASSNQQLTHVSYEPGTEIEV